MVKDEIIRALVIAEESLPMYAGAEKLPGYEKSRMLSKVANKTDRFIGKSSGRRIIAVDSPTFLPSVSKHAKPVAYSVVLFTEARPNVGSGYKNIYEARNRGDGKFLYIMVRESLDSDTALAEVERDKAELLLDTKMDKETTLRNLSGIRRVCSYDSNAIRQFLYSIVMTGPIQSVARTIAVTGYRPENEVMTNDEVLAYVARRVGIPSSGIKNNRKKSRTRTMLRHTVSAILRQVTSQSLEEIRKSVGHRDHSTVMYGIQNLVRQERKYGMTRPEIKGLPMPEQVERLTDHYLRLLYRPKTLEERTIGIA